MANDDNPKQNSSTQIQKNIWLVVIVALIALAAAFVIGLAAGRVSWRAGHGFGGMTYQRSSFMMDEGGGHMRGAIVKNSANANEDRLAGVVTAVNGQSFTIGGSGATNTVQTNSSTKWQNGSSVKVNDSVVVFGTTSNGTFTADQVIINP